MNYYIEIKNKLVENEIYSKVKDYSKERHRVITYYEIGKLLSEAGKSYGDGIIEKYANRLVVEVGKKYNERTLRRIRQFYFIFKEVKWSTVSTVLDTDNVKETKVLAASTLLSWSHYSEMLSIKDINKISYYIKICEEQNLSIRDLRSKIKSKEYERLDEKTKNKLINKEEEKIDDFIKNPILIKNSYSEEISEKLLKRLILEDMNNFLKELGNGFSYIDNEYKIKLGSRYNYIDLLLFNYIYNAFVVVELKITELRKEHIGQIKMYMNYIDKNIKSINQDSTIGIIICKKDNMFVMEYCSDSRVYRTIYECI